MEWDLDWDENHGYACPWFTISVDKKGRIKLNCYDEYVVSLSDEGLANLKAAVEQAYANRNT